ncbi:hypothetical protein [Paenibacillus apiarius]|uniref:hypothetical protein n=1 Tax=Paenibacillus apiarius TaxID=46240 RepID=UPI00300C9640
MSERNIYILLTDTGTLLSKMIKMYTRAPLNHVSIAFDADLREIYSFGRRDAANPFVGGFVKEQVHGSLIRTDGRPTLCALYRCSVTSGIYDQIRKRVQHMEESKEQYKYNFLGLFGIPFNLHIERENAYFCSQFVAALFQDSGMKLIDKSAALVTPDDFRKSKSLQLVFKGDLRNKVTHRAEAVCHPYQTAQMIS